MTTVAIPERIMMNKDVHFDSRWQRAPRLKKTVGPATRTGATHAASIKSVTLRRLVGEARGPLPRGARLKAIGPIGKGRPWFYVGCHTR